LGSLSILYRSSSGKLAIQWAKNQWLTQSQKSPPAPMPHSAPVKYETGSFSYWIHQADLAEAKGHIDQAIDDLNNALRINSFEQGVQIRKYFLLLRKGEVQEACPWFKSQTDISKADKLLSDAMCLEADGHPRKALLDYADFTRRFPHDRRMPEIKKIIETLIEKSKTK